MRVSLLTVGDELLIGQVTDTNAAFIGQYLSEHDISLVRSMTVADTLGDIVSALAHLRQDVDAVLVTGGLGPTEDDLTLEALALHLDRPLQFDAAVFERIAHIFEHIIKRPLSDSHRRQAMLPEGAVVLTNTQGTAPGVWLEADGQVLIAMPGVPREMKYLLRAEVVPKLTARFAVSSAAHRTLLFSGWGETQIADAIKPVVDSFDEHTSIAYLPGLGTVRLRLTARGASAHLLDTKLQELSLKLRSQIPDYLFVSDDGVSLVASVHQLLDELGATVAVAESCSGGAAGFLLTQQPGASRAFLGGIIAYDNRIKHELLGVPERTLAEAGAVSEAVVSAMAQGARENLGATYAIAASGIAGPTGGTPDKPVGTIWISAAGPRGVRTKQLSLGRDRSTNMEYTAVAAINLLRRQLLEDLANR